MPEDNQIQTGFQPEIQANLQIQQNNLVQNQQIIQQNNTESTEKGLPQNLRSSSSRSNKILGWLFIFLGLILNGFGIYAMYCQISDGYNSIGDVFTNSLVSFPILAGVCFTIIGIRNLFHGQKSHASWLVKIVSCIFGLLGITLIGLGIYGIFETQSDRHYSDYTIRDIIMDSGIFILGPLGIWLIILGILSYRTPNVDIYYHPTRLTKIFSGIYRFLGIALVRAGLRNFSLIGTEDLSFLKILYIGGAITLCGILYIFLGRLLYNTKNKMHLGFSMLCALIINIMFTRILRTFLDDGYFFEFCGAILAIFSLIYFLILTIRWIIKCRKFNKKGIIDPKYLDSNSSKKRVGIVTTFILFLPIIICLIYGKIQWSKIPEIDKSIFARKDHQVKLPDEEDGLVQLKKYMENLPNIFQRLDGITLKSPKNEEIGWQSHQDECIPVYSGGNSYCGTRVYNRKTIYRLLNQYIDENNYPYSSEESGKQQADKEKITLIEYLDKNDSDIKNTLLELDNILSMNYYIPNDEYLGVFPQGVQGFSRASTVLLQYYTWKKDWDMVILIVKVNYKIMDIANNVGGMINNLISIVLQGIINNSINSSINLLPENVRIEIINLLKKDNSYRENAIQQSAKGEFVIRNRAKKVGLLDDFGANEPSLKQFLFHFPFYSYKDTERLMLYTYSMIYNEEFNDDNFEKNIIGNWLSIHNLIYNYYGRRVFRNLAPRSQSFIQRLNYTEKQRDALINNLKYGEYKIRYNEAYRKFNPDMYNEYQLSSNNK